MAYFIQRKWFADNIMDQTTHIIGTLFFVKNPVIINMGSVGYSAVTLSVSEIPSITGIIISVSNRPYSLFSSSTMVAPPSATPKVSCPRSFRARHINVRTATSSSAINIRAALCPS